MIGLQEVKRKNLIILAFMTKFEPLKRDIIAHEGQDAMAIGGASRRISQSGLLLGRVHDPPSMCLPVLLCYSKGYLLFTNVSIPHTLDASMSSKRKWDDDANAPPPPPATTDAAAQAGKPLGSRSS